jgi:hypothetical protein
MNAMRIVGLFVVSVAVGCSGPTRTAGTGGKAAKDLAVLSIDQLPPEAHVQLDTIQFDDAGEAYKIGKDGRDFYLLPAKESGQGANAAQMGHTASFDFVAHMPSPESAGAPAWVGWMIPKEAKTIHIPGPKGLPLGAVAAGKTYELAPPTPESFQNLLQDGGGLTLVREKQPKAAK